MWEFRPGALHHIAIIGVLFALPANAENYPSQPIRLIAPYAAGGPVDTTARIVAGGLASRLQQPVVVENRPGAAATIGTDIVVKSKPDGYTLGVGSNGPIAIVPLTDPKLPYDPKRDLDVVAGITSVEGVVVASSKSPFNDIRAYIDAARAKPGQVSFATAGIASSPHLAFEHLQKLAAIKLLHVPYNGDIPALTSVLSGDVDVAVVSAASASPFLQDGRLKALGANGPGPLRIQSMPDLLSIAEQTGYSEYNPYTWTVLVAPKGTPQAIVEKLNSALNDTLRDPEIVGRLSKLGLRPLVGSVTEIKSFVEKETNQTKQIIEAVDLKRTF